MTVKLLFTQSGNEGKQAIQKKTCLRTEEAGPYGIDLILHSGLFTDKSNLCVHIPLGCHGD